MNLADQAQQLLAEMTADSFGDFSPSLYETARVAALAPRLAGHEGRIRFLLRAQEPAGNWGGPGEYALLPTLSAVDALFAELARAADPQVGQAVHRGLHALSRMLEPEISLPDTVAIEILVPWLVAELNTKLAALETKPLPGLGFWRYGRRLSCPSGTYPEILIQLREAVEHGAALPEKLWHSLEMLGPVAQGAPFVRAGRYGVGCSPAATAAWFGTEAAQGNPHPGVRYLEHLQARHGGPVPVAAPLDVFERAWVLTTFTDIGLPVTVPPELVEGLRAAFTESGVAGGAGLPPDADDTSTALHALANLGAAYPLDSLWEYQVDEHFATFPDERTPSVTTNAHVLQALAADPGGGRRVADTMVGLTEWLCGRQHEDGSWTDKWHASPYYATETCVVALASYGESTAAARKAVRWVLDTQHANGSWGFWDGTSEETAYAVQILLRAKAVRPDPAIEQAAARGCSYLLDSGDNPSPPLWHDKDLYTPGRIIRAETIAALHVAGTHPRVAARLARQDERTERTA
ncbi:prenyltransferase/squalene oxidase repeat-containing protein [Amycolatopsis sp. GM8]|uniref:prenyltransferase/squalene oxidase repeat-containing protein n=1 Tax=Amycolatopsis sp. GM8 TaxID=2896530 RepID=UPI001F163215|nr:prenyltransferase/squalene oxidase repeat-containing protein [Amycolatopsis sp. GM8]